MAEVGTYYITVMPSMNKFTAGVKKSLAGLGTDAGSQFQTGFLDVLRGSAIGTFLGNLATELGSELLAGLDRGIERIDTLENFPKVMESLGYESEAAERAIALIVEHLDGLPTASQDIVTLTQAIADSTGDLDLATLAALAFNDMMLANGASAGEMTQAMGVFNRVLGKGNATTAQWMSLQSVMPAQLALVARELMGEEASVEDLRDALNNGEISWNDFLEAMVKLDKDGTIDSTGKHIASFADQARANSHGIGTAITNIQNRIGAGWAKILEVFGRENIAGIIDKFSYGIRNAMYGVADALNWLKNMVLGSSIDESIVRIFNNIKDSIGGLDKVSLKKFARGAIDLIEGVLKWIADHGDYVATTLAGVAGAIAGIQGIKFGMWLDGALNSAKAFMAAMAANPVFLVAAAIGAVVAGLVWFFTQTKLGRELWAKFVSALKKLVKALAADFKKAFNQIKQNLEANKLVWENFKKKVVTFATETKQKVVDAYTALKTKLTTTVEAIKTAVGNTWNAITSTTTNVWNAIKTAVDTTVTTIKNVISTGWEAAKTAVSVTIAAIKTTVTSTWDAICTAVETTINALKTFLSGAWDAIKSTASSKATATKKAISDAWTAVKTAITNAINGVKTTLSSAWESIKTTATTKMENLKTGVTEKFEAVRTTVTTKIENLKTAAATKWESMRSTARQKIQDLKAGVVEKFENARSTVATKIENLKSALYNKWESIRSTARDKIQNLKEGVIEKFEAARTAVADKVSAVWNTITTVWGGIGDKVRNIFNGVKDALANPIQTAKDLIKGAIDTIKGFFNITLSFPHIKIPHFTIYGGVIPWGIGGKGTPPSISIDWYKKGGVFNTAQIIGIGEAGREAALPLNEKVYREIARGIAAEAGGTGGVVIKDCTWVIREEADIDRIAEAINRKVRRERRSAA